MRNKSYKEQYERMMRGFTELEEQCQNPDVLRDQALPINADRVYAYRDRFGDLVYHFFVDCWHLKDWIDHDNNAIALGVGKCKHKKCGKCVECFATNDKWLKICHDLCIGAKHSFVRSPKFDADTALDSIKISVITKGEKHTEVLGYVFCQSLTLFSMGLELQEDLEKQNFSERLRQEFTDKNVLLPQYVTIRIKQGQDTWTIHDDIGSLLYVVKKEDDSLNTYEPNNVLDLAKSCIDSWDTFIKTHGLP